MKKIIFLIIFCISIIAVTAEEICYQNEHSEGDAWARARICAEIADIEHGREIRYTCYGDKLYFDCDAAECTDSGCPLCKYVGTHTATEYLSLNEERHSAVCWNKAYGNTGAWAWASQGMNWYNLNANIECYSDADCKSAALYDCVSYQCKFIPPPGSGSGNNNDIPSGSGNDSSSSIEFIDEIKEKGFFTWLLEWIKYIFSKIGLGTMHGSSQETKGSGGSK